LRFFVAFSVVAVVVAVSAFAGVFLPAGATGVLSSVADFESAVGASVFLVDCGK
jgi:hypothetical protein